MNLPSFADKFNDRQKTAISDPNRRIVLNACAGSGKTATAAGWVSYHLSAGVPPSKLLMLTFARKAAKEMRERVVSYYKGSVKGLTSGTFHSVALSLFRENPAEFGLEPGFSISDEDTTESIWKRVLKDLKGDPKEAGRASSIHSLAVNQMVDPEEALLSGLRKPVKNAAGRFREEKTKNRLLDYDDILSVLAAKLDSDPRFAENLRERWSHVMVDEVQDNSELQYFIVTRLNPSYLFAVGDPNQCIYSFRGSAPALMRRFLKDHSDSTLHQLDINYRSGQVILDVANSSTSDSETPTDLSSGVEHAGVVSYHRFQNPAQEGREICRKVAEALADGESPNNVCVLFRSGFQALHLENELKRGRISYKKYGGMSISGAADVKDYLSLIRAFHNPADRPAMARVSCLFPGVGGKSAERVASSHDPKWPDKAKQAGEWLDEAHNMQWGEVSGFLLDKIVPLIEHNYPDDYVERIDRLRVIAAGAGEMAGASDFIDSYTIDPEESKHPEDSIILSTIHSAKGLEWQNVFLIGCGALQMPSRRAATAREVEEERRLFYVAVTRAGKSLTLSYSETSPDGSWQGPSPFSPPDAKWIPN